MPDVNNSKYRTLEIKLTDNLGEKVVKRIVTLLDEGDGLTLDGKPFHGLLNGHGGKLEPGQVPIKIPLQVGEEIVTASGKTYLRVRVT